MSINHQILLFNQCFTPVECDEIISALEFNKNTSYYYDKNEKHGSTRPKDIVKNSNVILDRSQYSWVYDRISEIVKDCNQHFEYDLDRIEDITIANYSVGDYYKKHHDLLMEMDGSRKISISIQLNSDFKGGELILHTGHEPYIPAMEQGNGCIFNAYILHEITHVVAGERISLVVHISGPKFR